MKRVWLTALALLCLTGCTSLELEDRLLAVSMGLEKTLEGKLQISVQVPVSGGSTGEKQGEYLVLSAQGEDWEDAMDSLEEETPHRISFSQLRQVVIREPLARSDGFAPLLAQVFRRHQVRSNAYVVVTPDDTKAFMEKQKPDTGGHLGKYLDTVMKNLVEKQFVPNAVLGLVVRDIQGGIGDPPLIRAHAEENGISYLGSALTAQGQVCGWLNGHQTQLLKLLNGGGKRVNIRIPGGQTAEVSAFAGAKIHRLGEDRVRMALKVTAYAPIHAMPRQQELEEALQRELEELLTLLQACGSDAAGIGRQFHWGAKTLEEAAHRPGIREVTVEEVQVQAQLVVSAN